MEYLAAHAVEQQVGGVPVAEAEDVADHGHDGERAREVGPAVEPHLGRRRLQQQDLGQVVAVGVLQRVLEHLHLGEWHLDFKMGLYFGEETFLLTPFQKHTRTYRQKMIHDS